jgi:hypothetical protein
LERAGLRNRIPFVDDAPGHHVVQPWTTTLRQPRSAFKRDVTCLIDTPGGKPSALNRSEARRGKLMRKLLKKYAFVPERLVTGDLRSYRAAVHVLSRLL